MHVYARGYSTVFVVALSKKRYLSDVDIGMMPMITCTHMYTHVHTSTLMRAVVIQVKLLCSVK